MPGYDVFISHSQGSDSQLAMALRDGLETLAKKWTSRRSLRAFVDSSGLALTSDLWRTLSDSLDRSEWLVLVASPQSATSDWVGKEVSHWLSTHDLDHLLIVRTEGEIEWDEIAGDFDWRHTTCLPRALVGRYASEPRFLDLSWTRHESYDLGNVRFRKDIGDIAAPIHGMDRDDFDAEDVRQQARGRRFRRLAVGGLLVLALATSLASVLAVRAASQASAERDRATEEAERATAAEARATAEAERATTEAENARVEARRALSHQLSAEAQATSEEDPDLALLLALSALGVEESLGQGTPDGSALATLVDTLTAWPHLAGIWNDVRFIADAGTEPAEAFLRFSPDDRLLALPRDGRWEFREVPSGDVLWTMEYLRFVFSPDGTVVARSSSRGLDFVDSMSGEVVGHVGDGTDAYPIAFSADGRRIAGIQGGAFKVWNTLGELVSEYYLPETVVIGWDEALDNLLMTASLDSSLFARLVDLGSGESFAVDAPVGGSPLLGDEGFYGSTIALSPDGATVVTRQPGDSLMSVTNPRTAELLSALEGVGVSTMAYGPPSSVAYADSTGLTIVDEQGATTHLPGSIGLVTSLAFNDTGTRVAAAGDGRVLVWDLGSGGSYEVVVQSDAEATRASIALSPSLRMAAAVWSDGLTIWDLDNPFIISRRLMDGDSSAAPVPESLAFGPNGTRLAVGTSWYPMLWDTLRYSRVDERTNVEAESVVGRLATLPDSADFETRVALISELPSGGPVVAHPSDEVVVALNRDTADMLETDSLRLVATKSLPEALRNAPVLALSADGKVAAMGGDDLIRLIDVESGRDIRSISLDGIRPIGGSLDGSGATVAILTRAGVSVFSSDDEVMWWDEAALGLSIVSVGLSWDGAVLATGESSGSVTLWDIESGNAVATLPPVVFGESAFQSFLVTKAIALSPALDVLAVGGFDGLVLWEVGRDAWVRAACGLAGRPMTEMERILYFGPEAPLESVCTN